MELVGTKESWKQAEVALEREIKRDKLKFTSLADLRLHEWTAPYLRGKTAYSFTGRVTARTAAGELVTTRFMANAGGAYLEDKSSAADFEGLCGLYCPG